MSGEIDIEPVPGLPHALPPGEELLWQGRPRWRGLYRHTFEARWLAAYFGIFTVARGAVAFEEHGLAAGLLAMAMVLPLAGLCLAVLALLAWMNARATVYTITSRRVVMRFGVAIPMTFNFPFKRIGAASLVAREAGEGDIALQLSGPDRIAWLHLWPHARPWSFRKAQPMLRAIPDVARVSDLLADAVMAWSAAEKAAVMMSEVETETETGTDAENAIAPALVAQAGR